MLSKFVASKIRIFLIVPLVLLLCFTHFSGFETDADKERYDDEGLSLIHI